MKYPWSKTKYFAGDVLGFTHKESDYVNNEFSKFISNNIFRTEDFVEFVIKLMIESKGKRMAVLTALSNSYLTKIREDINE